jgi:beta-galactosidase
MEARAGWNDERGRAADVIPGLGLFEVAGARETDVQTVAKGAAALVALEGLPGLSAGDRLPGRWFEETLEPVAGARAVARFASGAPAAVVSSFGKGKALTLGSYVSAGFVSQPDPATRRFFEGLLDWAGVVRPVASTGDALEVRLLETSADRIAFVFNHAAKPATASVTFRGVNETSAEDLVTARPVQLTAGSGGVAWRGTIAPRDVLVLRLKKGAPTGR